MDPKHRIIHRAAEMFLDEGIKSVRMDDIATRLGVSKRTLYEMFGDKRDLLEQSVAHYFVGKRQAILSRTAEADNVLEEIFLMMYTMKRDERDVALAYNLKKFYPEIYHRLELDAYEFTRREFDRLIAGGIRQGLFVPSLDKSLAADTLMYMVSVISEKMHNFGPSNTKTVSCEAMFEFMTVNFFRGLATRKGVETIDRLVEKYKDSKI